MEVLPVLCALGILCSLALAAEKTIPPEDQDGSGDDEDFSGASGFDAFNVNLESSDVKIHSTDVSTLVPTIEGSTAAQEPEVVDQEETKMEVTTKSAETTKGHNDVIEDLFAVDTVAKEVATQEATTSPSQQTSTDDLIEEIDTKKHHHHHHHHHHHPHHHTTTSSPESDGRDDATDVPPEVVGGPHDLPVNTTVDVPDEEPELHPQSLTTTAEHLIEHGVLHEETTSSSTSTYAGDEKVAIEAIDADLLPGSNTLTTSTVPEESHTQDHHPHHHHHHHHHPHPHQTTTSSLDGSDIQQETTVPSDLIEPEDNLQEEPTVAVAEDKPLHHGHPDHTHHHDTTPSTPGSTEPEKPHEVHTHEPKGRRIHVPDVGGTTAGPLINGDAEKDDFTSSTVVCNVSRSPSDDDLSDSEEGSSGPTDGELYFEGTVPVVKEGRMIPENPSPDNGSSNASQGIMERKELLAGIIAGGVAGLVFAAFLVAFVLYRMKKKDEGSYSLEEPKQSNGGYQKPREQREFYA